MRPLISGDDESCERYRQRALDDVAIGDDVVALFDQVDSLTPEEAPTSLADCHWRAALMFAYAEGAFSLRERHSLIRENIRKVLFRWTSIVPKVEGQKQQEIDPIEEHRRTLSVIMPDGTILGQEAASDV
jgi:hypothetical protein